MKYVPQIEGSPLWLFSKISRSARIRLELVRWLGTCPLDTPDGQFQVTLVQIWHRSRLESISGFAWVAWEVPSQYSRWIIPSFPNRSRKGIPKGQAPNLHQCVLELAIWTITRTLSKPQLRNPEMESNIEWCLILAQVCWNRHSGVSRRHFMSHRTRCKHSGDC